jgi:hypothetical protein
MTESGSYQQSEMHAGACHALAEKCVLAAVVMALVYFSLTASTFSQAFESPEALVHARAQLMGGDCGLNCSRKIAGMYSRNFLKRNKDSLVESLGSSPNRAADVHILFGKDIAQSELKQMSPIDVFANQLQYRSQSTPREYRFPETGILGKKTITLTQVQITVRKHGLPPAPRREEEEIINLVKEGGAWRISY